MISGPPSAFNVGGEEEADNEDNEDEELLFELFERLLFALLELVVEFVVVLLLLLVEVELFVFELFEFVEIVNLLIIWSKINDFGCCFEEGGRAAISVEINFQCVSISAKSSERAKTLESGKST